MRPRGMIVSRVGQNYRVTWENSQYVTSIDVTARQLRRWANDLIERIDRDEAVEQRKNRRSLSRV